MGLKSAVLLKLSIAALLIIPAGTSWAAEKTLHLNLCQELVNQARSYETRAASHSSVAKTIRQQIEVHSAQAKTPGMMAVIDNLFAQYHEHRAMENECRDLARKTSEDARKCMKEAE